MPPSVVAPLRPRDQTAAYYYRRPLGVRELLPAIGVAIGAGLMAFYIIRLMLQRTPLDTGGHPRIRAGEASRASGAPRLALHRPGS